jgi:phosphate uptake regulator
MKRKVNRVGKNTLTVSLPSKWTQKHKISAGEEVDIEEHGNKIVVFKSDIEQRKNISLSIDDLSYFALAKVLHACYEQNYDTVTLTFSKSYIKSYFQERNVSLFDSINNFVSRLVTFEIISQQDDKIVIKDISEKLVQLNTIISRVFFLCEEYLDCLIKDIKTGNREDLEAALVRHDGIAKYVTLACRMLLQEEIGQRNYVVHNYLILNYLDKSADFLRAAYRHTKNYKKKISVRSINLLEKALEYLKTLRKLYYKFDYNTMMDLDALKGDIQKISSEIASSSPSELIVISDVICMITALHGTVKSRIALHLDGF